jgi:hypothetical protein
MKTNEGQRNTAYNSTYPKVAVQWLNQALSPPQADFCLVDSFVLPCLPAGKEIRHCAKRQNVNKKSHAHLWHSATWRRLVGKKKGMK